MVVDLRAGGEGRLSPWGQWPATPPTSQTAGQAGGSEKLLCGVGRFSVRCQAGPYIPPGPPATWGLTAMSLPGLEPVPEPGACRRERRGKGGLVEMLGLGGTGESPCFSLLGASSHFVDIKH